MSGRRRGGPGDDLVERRSLTAQAGLGDDLSQSGDADRANGGGRAGAASDGQGDLAGPEILEASSVTGHGRVEVFANLAAESAHLFDQITAMADEHLQLLVIRRRGGLHQAEAIGGSSVNAREIGVVGFVAGVRDLAELLGGVRMDEPDFKACLAKGTLHGSMVLASAFDGDDQIAKLVAGLGFADAIDCRVEPTVRLVEFDRFDEGPTIEVSKHHLEPLLGEVDAQDAELFRTDGRTRSATTPLGFCTCRKVCERRDAE